MEKFLVERILPGAENLSETELLDLAEKMVGAEKEIQKAYSWVESYVTEDKIVCVVFAESVEAIREHARAGGLPVNIISKVKTMITDPNGRRS